MKRFMTTAVRRLRATGGAAASKVAPAPAPAGDTIMQTTEKQHLLLVLHGQRMEDPGIREAIAALRDAGHSVTIRLTYEAGDAEMFVQEALSAAPACSRPEGERHQGGGCPYNTIVAGGGDGTLNEVVSALLKHNAPPEVTVAQLPLGTANDLASVTGISLQPMEALALAADPSRVRPIDVALVNGGVFMNVATAGPVSEVSSAGLNPVLKKALGPLSMFVAGFHKAVVEGVDPKPGIKLTYPAEEGATLEKGRTGQVQGDLLVLAAGQGRQMGRSINCCPDALLDDGSLDFTLVWGKPGEQVAQLAQQLVSSGIQNAGGGVQMLRAPWLLVESPEEEIKVNRDGEPSPPSKRLLFEILPKRIRMHLPPSADHVLQSGLSEDERTSRRALVPPAEGVAAQRMMKIKKGRAVRRGLLQDILTPCAPPGLGAKRRAALMKQGARLLRAAALVAAGYGLAWLEQQRRHKEEREA